MPAELRRVTVPDNLVQPWEFSIPESEKNRPVPFYRTEPRPDSKLPAPGQQYLKATLGRILGCGGSSVVCASRYPILSRMS